MNAEAPSVEEGIAQKIEAPSLVESARSLGG